MVTRIRRASELMRTEDLLPALVSGITGIQANTVRNSASGEVQIHVMNENGDRYRFTRAGALGLAVLLFEACRHTGDKEIWSSPTQAAGEYANRPFPTTTADDPCPYSCNFCLFKGKIRDDIQDCPCEPCQKAYEQEIDEATKNDEINLGDWDPILYALAAAGDVPPECPDPADYPEEINWDEAVQEVRAPVYHPYRG